MIFQIFFELRCIKASELCICWTALCCQAKITGLADKGRRANTLQRKRQKRRRAPFAKMD